MTDRFEQRAFPVPRDATELVIVRHRASATLDRGKPFALVGGHSDPPLSPAGERRAEVVGERLRDEPFRALFVTSLQRTAQTAAPLAAASGLEPEVLEDLREVDLGRAGPSGDEASGRGTCGEHRIRLIERDPVAMRALMDERWVHADNGSITRLAQFAHGHRLLRCFNETAHLAAAT
jgi:2,3-bisphosphoglycerate-dependent phosphoglycerate mutase